MNSGMSNWDNKSILHLSSCQNQALLTRHFSVLGLINGSKNIQSYCFAQQVLGTKSIRPPTNCIPAKLRRCRQNRAPRKQLNHFTPSELSSMPSIQFFRSFCDISQVPRHKECRFRCIIIVSHQDCVEIVDHSLKRYMTSNYSGKNLCGVERLRKEPFHFTSTRNFE